MNIHKAIEILSFFFDNAIPSSDPDLENAVTLGIKALKAIKKQRDPRFPIQGELLPGETDA